MTLVDTSSWIHFLRRNGEIHVKDRVRTLMDRGEAVVCPVVLVELWMGAGSVKDRQDISDIQSLLINLETDSRIWTRASKLATICCSKGTPVPSSDAIIAACAFVHGAGIEAVDAHFSTLARYRDL
jgi:predicted nucleic acid-binding protein